MKTMFAALAALAAFAAAANADPPKQQNSCFFIRQGWTWKAPDARTIYIKVFPNRFYRLDLAGQCPELMWSNAQLITTHRSTSTICNALDWDLQVRSATGGAPVPCIVKRMTGLTPAEVADIPDKYKPR